MSDKSVANHFGKLDDKLNYLIVAIAEFKRLALMAGDPTRNNSPIALTRYNQAYALNVGENIEKNLPLNNKPTLMQEAFATTLAAMEAAPAEAQLKMLKELLPFIDKHLAHADAQSDNDDIEYYCGMLHDVGPRLDPIAQAIMLEWTVDNIMANIHDYKCLPSEDWDKYDPDSFADKYHGDSKALSGRRILAALDDKESIQSRTYTDEIISWVSTLIPKDDPRFITEFELPSWLGFSRTRSVWVLPTLEGNKQVVLVNETNHEDSDTLPTMMAEFKGFISQLFDSQKLHTYKSSIPIVIETLRTSFLRHAEKTGEHPELQKVLVASAATLQEFKIDT